jgi:hypothetical protein
MIEISLIDLNKMGGNSMLEGVGGKSMTMGNLVQESQVISLIFYEIERS